MIDPYAHEPRPFSRPNPYGYEAQEPARGFGRCADCRTPISVTGRSMVEAAHNLEAARKACPCKHKEKA